MKRKMKTDEAIDRLLKATLRGNDPQSSAACVDAETLAAWSDGTLSTDEAGAVELHVSNCARCQAVMAVFAKTEPAAAAAVPFWRRWPVGWLIPVATAAAVAALVIWVASPAPTPSIPADRIARTELQPAPVAPPAPLVPEPQTAAAAQPAATATPATPSPALPAAPQIPATTSPSASPAPPALPAPQTAAAKAAPAAAPPAPRSPEEAVTVSGSSPVNEVQRARPSALAADSVTAASIEIVSSAFPGPAAAQGGAGRGGGRAGGAVIAAPPARWRILPSGSIERSMTSGASWERVATYAPGAITGGAAPSASVCWLIGRAGIVLLAIDGRFERLSFPATADLASIRATDARQATVTTTDGRVFNTTDGGASWR